MPDHPAGATSPRAVVALVHGILAGTEGLYMSDVSSSDLEAALDSPLALSGDPEVAATIREELSSRVM